MLRVKLMIGDREMASADGRTFRRLDPVSGEVASEADYCLYCHEREKDSCSTGMHDKSGAVKRNPLGVKIGGCPLDEKIGEMHVLRKDGDSIAALAMICVDNPMLPGTGHRICNDCMKGCVFQKQEPVNIPQAETGVLTDVLGMRCRIGAIMRGVRNIEARARELATMHQRASHVVEEPEASGLRYKKSVGHEALVTRPVGR